MVRVNVDEASALGGPDGGVDIGARDSGALGAISNAPEGSWPAARRGVQRCDEAGG
jgi:hypothetical protein